MDCVNAAYMLELSYRLTVAVNMAEHNNETFGWMDTWHNDSFFCAQHWHKHLLSTMTGKDDRDRMLIADVSSILDALKQGYGAFSGSSLGPSHAVHGYEYLWDITHRIAYAPIFGKLGFGEFFMLGQQLAQNDLRAHFSAIGKAELPVIVASEPPFERLVEKSFPCSWPNWPQGASFNDHLIRYVDNRHRLAGRGSFSMGALLCLTQSIICPKSFPSTVWCWQDWEKGNPWHLFLAGAIFSIPAHVMVKDRNDKAIITLLEAMDKAKKAGCLDEECGWVPRNELWPDIKSSNTRSKAWRKLTKKTLVLLGEFESKGGVGKYKDTGGPCRVPAALAQPECRLFFEKSK